MRRAASRLKNEDDEHVQWGGLVLCAWLPSPYSCRRCENLRLGYATGWAGTRDHLTAGKSSIIGDFTDTATERYAVIGPVNGVFRFKIQKYKSQFFSSKKTVTATVKR